MTKLEAIIQPSRFEAVKDALQLAVVEVVAQIQHALLERVAAAVLAEDQFRLR